MSRNIIDNKNTEHNNHCGLKYYFNKYINLKMGILSGIITGSVVFIINIDHGFWPAFASFWKQFIFNVFMAGYNTKSCERIADAINSNFIAIPVASIIPSLQAFVILFAIHYFGHTPEPLGSTLWQLFANLMFFFFLTLIYKNIINFRCNIFGKITNIKYKGLQKKFVTVKAKRESEK